MEYGVLVAARLVIDQQRERTHAKIRNNLSHVNDTNESNDSSGTTGTKQNDRQGESDVVKGTSRCLKGNSPRESTTSKEALVKYIEEGGNTNEKFLTIAECPEDWRIVDQRNRYERNRH